MTLKALPNSLLPDQFQFSTEPAADDAEPVSFTIDTYNYILKPPLGGRRGWYATVREQAPVKLTATRRATILYGPYPREEDAIQAVQDLLQKSMDAAEESGNGDIVVSRDDVLDRSDEKPTG